MPGTPSASSARATVRARRPATVSACAWLSGSGLAHSPKPRTRIAPAPRATPPRAAPRPGPTASHPCRGVNATGCRRRSHRVVRQPARPRQAGREIDPRQARRRRRRAGDGGQRHRRPAGGGWLHHHRGQRQFGCCILARRGTCRGPLRPLRRIERRRGRAGSGRRRGFRRRRPGSHRDRRRDRVVGVEPRGQVALAQQAAGHRAAQVERRDHGRLRRGGSDLRIRVVQGRAAAGAAARSRALRASATSRPGYRRRRGARIPRLRPRPRPRSRRPWSAGPAGRSTLVPLARATDIAHLFLDRHTCSTAAFGRVSPGLQPGRPIAAPTGLAWRAARAKPACIGAGCETGYDSRMNDPAGREIIMNGMSPHDHMQDRFPDG